MSTLIQTDQYDTNKQFGEKIGNTENKIPNINGLVITAVLKTKTGEVESKIPDTSGLVTTAVLHIKTEEVENKG